MAFREDVPLCVQKEPENNVSTNFGTFFFRFERRKRHFGKSVPLIFAKGTKKQRFYNFRGVFVPF